MNLSFSDLTVIIKSSYNTNGIIIMIKTSSVKVADGNVENCKWFYAVFKIN
jgi:hypothetical protein